MILWLHWASLLFLFPILLFSSFIRNLVLAKIEEDMKLDEDRILRARALMENGLKIELWIIIRPLPPRGDGFLRRKPTFSTNIKRQTIFSLLTTSHWPTAFPANRGPSLSSNCLFLQTIFSRTGQFPGPGLSGGVSKLPALPVWDWLPVLRVSVSTLYICQCWHPVLTPMEIVLFYLFISFS